MPLINWEVYLDVNWFNEYVATPVANEGTTLSIIDTKLYVPVVTLSTYGDAKIFEQLKSGFKRTIYGNNYQPKVSPERPNQYLDYLIDPKFQEVNRLFNS